MSLKIRPVWFLLSIVILIELGYTRLIPIPALQSAWLSYKYIPILCLAIFLYSLTYRKSVGNHGFYSRYAYLVIIFFAVECLYPIIMNGAPLNEVISSGIRFLILLVPTVVLDRTRIQYMGRFINYVVKATVIMLIFRFILWGIYTTTNHTFLTHLFYYFRYYNGVYRMDGSALCMPVLIYEWYNFLYSKSRKSKIMHLSCASIAACYVIVVNQSRALAICMIITLLLMWLMIEARMAWKVISILIGMTVIYLLATSSYMMDLVASLSPSDAVYGGSTSVRTDAIEYYLSVKGVSAVGFGFLPVSNAYISLLRGPGRNYYFEDLGIMGVLFSNGIFGVALYILPILRTIQLYFKLKKRKLREATFMIGFIAYNIVGLVSLSQFDSQRIVGYVMMMCLAEWLYANSLQTGCDHLIV